MVGAPAPAGLLDDLVARHGEPGRSYHTLAHVLDCLEKTAITREIQDDPAAVELALWFHDAVYDPRRSDNEERSAALAEEALARPLGGERAARVAELVLATRHRAPPPPGDAAVVVDADLSILGAAPDAYDAYAEAVRREYSWVPGFLYRRRRAKVLRSFLARDRIFTTEPFHERYEARARANLERALAGT
jgi:predicted metal-dependent HD superfamily phosphohydrolase